MSSPDDSDEPSSPDSISLHDSFLPEWQRDDVACEMCGDAGGAAKLIICDNCEHGCALLPVGSTLTACRPLL